MGTPPEALSRYRGIAPAIARLRVSGLTKESSFTSKGDFIARFLRNIRSRDVSRVYGGVHFVDANALAGTSR